MDRRGQIEKLTGMVKCKKGQAPSKLKNVQAPLNVKIDRQSQTLEWTFTGKLKIGQAPSNGKWTGIGKCKKNRHG